MSATKTCLSFCFTYLIDKNEKLLRFHSVGHPEVVVEVCC